MSLGNAAANFVTSVLEQFSTPPNPLATSLMHITLANEGARKAAMGRAWAAYLGQFAAPLKARKGAPPGQDTVRVNRVAPVVAASAHFLFGTPPTYTIPGPVADPTAPTAPSTPDELDTQAWMAAVERANSWPAMLLDWAVNGGVCGTPYLRIVPPVRTLPPGAKVDWATVDPEYLPHVVTLDPGTMETHTDPRDTTRLTAYVWQWQTGDVGLGGQTRAARQVIEPTLTGWLITDQTSTGGGMWVTQETTDWPFPFPPIVHNKNLPNPNAVYGLPDVTDSIIEINHGINFVLSNSLRVYRLHAHPKLWASGLGADSKLDAAPDSVWYLPDVDSKVGQLVPAVNPNAGESLTDALDASISQEAQTPGLLLGRVEKGTLPPSGTALRTELWPMLAKTLAKRTLYGPALEEVWRRLFVVSRRTPRPVHVQWPEILPMDPLEQRQALAIDVTTLGVSKASAQRKVGYNPAVEAAALATESTDVGGAANPHGDLAPGGDAAPTVSEQ